MGHDQGLYQDAGSGTGDRGGREGGVTCSLGVKLTGLLNIDSHSDDCWVPHGTITQKIKLFGPLLKWRCLLGLHVEGPER